MTDDLHNRSIEHAVLAAILYDNATLDSLVRLEPAHFHDAELREIFTTARDLRRDGRPINPVTLRSLTGADPLGGATVADRLKAVSFADVPPAPRDMADALIDLAHRRELKALGETLVGAVGNLSAKPRAIAEMIMRECDKLLAAGQPAGQTYWMAPDAVNEGLDQLMRNDDGGRLSTGIAALDSETGGLHRKGSPISGPGPRWENRPSR